MYKLYTLVKRDIINIFKNPILLISNSVFTFLLILILGFLNHDIYGNLGIDSYDYYGVTIILFAILNVAMTASNSFMEKSLKSSNMRVIYSPVPKSFIYLSKIIATFLFTGLCILFNMVVAGLFLGVNFGGVNVGYILVLFLLFDLLTTVIGVAFCCILKSEESTNQILSLVMNIFAFLGGLFFQLDGFGDFVKNLSYISPVKWITDSAFRVIYDKDFSLYIPTLVVILGMILFFLMICKLSFKSEDYV